MICDDRMGLKTLLFAANVLKNARASEITNWGFDPFVGKMLCGAVAHCVVGARKCIITSAHFLDIVTLNFKVLQVTELKPAP